MLSFDSNNYDSEIYLFSKQIKDISSHMAEVDSLITSLLFDTYTNSTFVASDLNVIRYNTSMEWEKITTIESELSQKLYSSAFEEWISESLTNYFMTSDSTVFMTLSDSTVFMTLSDSISSISDSISSISDSISEISDSISSISESVSSLQSEILKSTLFMTLSDSTLLIPTSVSSSFALSSDVSDISILRNNVTDISSAISLISDSFSEYTPLTDYNALVSSFTDFTSAVPTSQQFNYHSPWGIDSISDKSGLNIYYLTGTQSDPTSITFSNLNFQSPVNFINQNVYIQGFNTLSSPTFNGNLVQRDGSVGFDMLNINGFDICSNTFSGASNFKYLNFTGLNISENSFSSQSIYINGYSDFVSNTFNSSNTISVSVLNDIISNSFSNNSFISLSCLANFSINSIVSVWKIVSVAANTFSENTFASIGSLYAKASSFFKNSLQNINTFSFDGHKSNYFESNTINTCPVMTIKIPYINSNSFNGANNMTIDLRDSFAGSIINNTFSNINRLDIYVNHSTSRPLYFWQNSFNQYNQCMVNIIFDHSNPYRYYDDITKSFVDPYSGIYITNLYFNGRNKFVDSGYNPQRMFFSHHSDGVLNTNSYVGTLETLSGDLYDWYTGVPVQKWGANFNCLKHYGILYSSSDSTKYHYKDFWEFDANALEAGHNNNACENLGIIKNRVSYSTTGYKYTYYQWPSISINVPTAAYNGGTYINGNSIWTNISKAMLSKWLSFNYTLATRESNWNSYTRADYNLEWLSDFSSVFNLVSQNSQLCGTMSFNARVIDP